MTSPVPADPLAEAARAAGIVDGYWDIGGTYRPTSDQLRRALLRPLGDPARTAPPFCDPALVIAETRQPAVIGARTEGPVDVAVRLEDSSERRYRLTADRFVTLPEHLPQGYHDVVIRDGAREGRTRLIVCPERAWLPPALEKGERRAGVAVSLYGLRGANTWGCGDFTALRGLIDWVAEDLGGSYIALNPLHAIHNRQPYNTSPYLPSSSYYRNFLYLDIDRVPDLAACPAATALRGHGPALAEIEACNNAEFVEYERVAQLKLRFLRLLWDRFQRQELEAGSERAADFRRYCGAEGDLLDSFATYCALDEYLHSQDPDVWIWPDWPEEFRDPASPAVARFRERHAPVVDFFKYVQWLVDSQAAEAQAYAVEKGLEIGLFHDLPLATDRCGSELWAHRAFFVEGCRVGSPPDDFAPKGQDWAFPPPNRDAHRADGYRLFAETIRKAARHGGALRIDHVMRLFRLYWIPDGYDATEGAYVRDYHQDLLGVLALESHRNKAMIVGEDLGTIEPYMREALDAAGVLSYRLFYFEKRGDGSMQPAAAYPDRALVSSTTHDLPTLAGFWSGQDIETRRELGLFPDHDSYRQAVWFRAQDKKRMFDALRDGGFLHPRYPEEAAHWPVLSGELHDAITGFLAATPSLLMTVNQEDLTKEVHQQNLPGTTWQYPNWRRKMSFTVEELRTNPRARDMAAMFRNRLAREKRLGAQAIS